MNFPQVVSAVQLTSTKIDIIMDSQTQDEITSEKVQFKRTNRVKSVRKRPASDEDHQDGDESEWQTLDELKEIQKLKKKVNRGVNVSDLKPEKIEKTTTEPKAPSSGLTDAKSIASELDLGNTFSAETNRRDEDAELMKFIEEELAKKKGLKTDPSSQDPSTSSRNNPEDMIFSSLPEHLLMAGGRKKNEEMLSNQMLSGIPEIDLGIDERIRNIEATEEAKTSMIYSRLRRDGSSSTATSNLVPVNMAVNFAQNNRHNVSENDLQLLTQKKKPQVIKPVITVVEEPVVVIGDEPRQGTFKSYPERHGRQLVHPGREKASDDYHFEKFRKQFRK